MAQDSIIKDNCNLWLERCIVMQPFHACINGPRSLAELLVSIQCMNSRDCDCK